jgi:hypothetical protein
MLGRPVVVPPALAAALSRPKLAIGIPATLDALVPFLAG